MSEGYKDETKLRELYLGEGATVYDLAERFDCAASTVRYWMDKFDIERRGQSSEKVSREELIRELRRVAGELGSPPTYHTIGEHGEYSGSPYQREFGSWNAALEAAGVGKNRTELVEVVCETCGDSFERSRHYLDRNGQHFCSRECKHEYSRTTVTCDHCGDDFQCRRFYAENNYADFCSNECYRQHRSKSYEGQGSPRWVARIEVDCDHCGEALLRRESETGARNFCDYDCKHEWSRQTDTNTGEDSHFWKGGKVYYYGPNWLQQRRRAMDRDGGECQDCGLPREQHRERYGQDLHCHHKVPILNFKQNGSVDYESANELSNLIILCGDCHVMRE